MDASVPGDKNAHAVAEACAKAMWLDDHASKGLGMSLQRIAPGEAVLSMTVRKDMTNGHRDLPRRLHFHAGGFDLCFRLQHL